MKKCYNERISISDEILNYPKSFYGYVVYITSVEDIGFFLNIEFQSQDDPDASDEFNIPVKTSQLTLDEIDTIVQKKIGLQHYTIDISSISNINEICL